jgi:hypothetical protein
VYQNACSILAYGNGRYDCATGLQLKNARRKFAALSADKYSPGPFDERPDVARAKGTERRRTALRPMLNTRGAFRFLPKNSYREFCALQADADTTDSSYDRPQFLNAKIAPPARLWPWQSLTEAERE